MAQSEAFHDRCRALFADVLGHGTRWKTACSTGLGIGRATLYRYFEEGASVPPEVLKRLDALERSTRPLPNDEEMVRRYARALRDVQGVLDDHGSLRRGLPPNARRVFDIAAALNFVKRRDVWPTDIASLVARAEQPLYDWVSDLSWDVEGEFATARLVEQGAITPDCARLAAPGGDVESELAENSGYKMLRGLCEELPTGERDAVYAAWRRFVISHPVLPSWTTAIYTDPVLSVIDRVDALIDQFYQPVPEALASGGQVPVCKLSRTILRRHGRAYETDCREPDAIRAAREGEHGSVAYRLGMVHLRRAFRMFWCLPGRAELELERQLTDAGWTCVMWPRLDRVDLVATSPNGSRRIAVDVKDHLSPVNLAARFTGFKDYTVDHECYLVIPDYILALSPQFASRFGALRASFDRSSVALRTMSALVEQLGAA